MAISKLGPLSFGPGANVISLSKFMSNKYGLACSCTTHNVDFSCTSKGRGLYNLNNTSYPVVALFNATLTAIYC